MLLPAVTDLDLLGRFVSDGDAEAFNIVARRHADLVYQTCLRVLRNSTEAQDAAQETFHQLMRTPEAVDRNVPAWLHAVATRKSLDHIRSESARRRRERAYQIRLDEDRRAREAGSWGQVEKQVDVALSRLRMGARDLLVAHFLVGTPQKEMARQAGVSRPTMCRRINAALAELRAQMDPADTEASGSARRRPGGAVKCGGAVLFALPAGAASAAPAELMTSVGKMAMLSGTLFGTGVRASTAAFAMAGITCLMIGVVGVACTAATGFTAARAPIDIASPMPCDAPAGERFASEPAEDGR